MRLRYKIGSVLTVLAGMFLWGRCSKTSDFAVPKPAAVLPAGDSEEISLNPDNHTLSIKTDKGTIKTVTLPDRVSTVEVRKDGTVKVTAPQFGLEHHLFLGASVSDAGRLAIGCDLLYFKKLDLGLGLADQFGTHTPIGLIKITYTVYGNIQAGMAYGTNRYVGGIVSVRLF